MCSYLSRSRSRSGQMATSGIELALARAQRVHSHFGIDQLEDIDLPVLAWGLKLLVQEGPIVSSLDAWMIDLGKTGIARVRETIPYVGQKRFAIAHELGHWLLHRGRTQAHLDSPEQLNDYRKSPMEVEANAFAAEVLMPRELFLREFPGSSVDLSHVCEVAERIGVGPTAATKRLVSMAPVNALMVAHRDGATAWYDRSSRCTLPAILPRTKVPTVLTEHAGIGPRLRRQCPATEWLPRMPANRMLDEQTLWIPDGPAITVLTPL